jgi:hypothetical protein
LPRRWDLAKASGNVLVKDKQWLVFPLISAVASGIVFLAFILRMLGMGGLDGINSMIGDLDDEHTISAGAYLLGFLFYVFQYFVIF